MTQLDVFAAYVLGPTFSKDAERFSWLQDQLSEIAINFVHPVDPIQEMLATYSAEVARHTGTSRADGWIAAARTLREALPDPDDQFYGILIASEAWALELRYPLDDMARFLRRMRELSSSAEDTGDEAQDAYQLYEHLLNRMMDIDGMLEREIDGEPVPREWSANPDTVTNAIDLLDRSVAARIDRAENAERREVETEEIDAILEQGGLYLRACFRAREAGVVLEEIATFVRTFPNAWADLLEDIVRESALAPGILIALAEARPDESRAAAYAAELIAAHRDLRPDCTLREYLRNCLSAVEQEA